MQTLPAPLLIFLCACVQCFAVHLVNREALRDAGRELREGVTVMTSDDAAYLVPPENALAGRGWRTNAAGSAAYIGRSPGYGSVILGLRSFLPKGAALWALFVLQVAVFAFAASVVPETARHLGVSRIPAAALGWLTALWPGFSGFLSYTLTEGLVPSAVLIFLWLSSRAIAGDRRALIGAGALLGWIITARIPMLIWLLPFGVLVYRAAKSGHARSGIIAAAAALLPFLVWQIHTSRIAGEYAGLHPIYRWDSNDLYRPVHGEIWNLHKMWGQRGADFHRDMETLWSAAEGRLPEAAALEKLADARPESVDQAIDTHELEAAYRAYIDILRKQLPHHYAGEPMPALPSPEEAETALRFRTLKGSYTLARPGKSLAAVPLRVYFVDMAAHSNLSLFIFQDTYRGKLWAETMRLFGFALHFGTFASFPLVLIFAARRRKLMAVALPVAVYLAWLAFVQRGVEERYTLPVFIPAVLVVAAVADDLIRSRSARLRIPIKFRN